MTATALEAIESAAAAAAAGDVWRACDELRAALEGDQTLGERWAAAATLAQQLGDTHAAAALARRYLRGSAGSATNAFFAASILTEVGLAKEAVTALSTYQEAGQLTADQRFKLSRMLMFAGRLESAQDLARSLLGTHSHSPTLWFRIAETKRFAADDPDIPVMRRIFETWPASRPIGRAAIAGALAKACVDVGDDEGADRYLRARAEADRARFRFDPRVYEAATRDLETWCEAGPADPVYADVTGSHRAIFILGPARSGTTLLDQVFSVHPAIAGGGESRHFWLASRPLDDCGTAAIGSYLARVRALDPRLNPWDEIARRYLSFADESFGPGLRFTDKLLSNIYRVRAIRQSLPDARVLMLWRRPLDVAWSCWRGQFDAESPWNTTPGGVALYIACYRRLMRAWERRYPEAVVGLAYESLTAEPESEIPRLLKACGLEDHPATRSPQHSARDVTTLSFAQARQPIHTGSINAADRFPVATRPLREALESLGIEP